MRESSMNSYKEFLKHFGIDPVLMTVDMCSRLPDSEKPRVLTTKVQKFLKGKSKWLIYLQGTRTLSFLTQIKEKYKNGVTIDILNDFIPII